MEKKKLVKGEENWTVSKNHILLGGGVVCGVVIYIPAHDVLNLCIGVTL